MILGKSVHLSELEFSSHLFSRVGNVFLTKKIHVEFHGQYLIREHLFIQRAFFEHFFLGSNHSLRSNRGYSHDTLP